MVQSSSLLLPCAPPKVSMKVYSVFFTTITIEYKIFPDLESFFLAHTRNLHPLSRLKMSSQPSSSRLLDLPREIRDMIYEYALTEDRVSFLLSTTTPRRVSEDADRLILAPSPTASNMFVVSYTTKPKA